LHWDPAKLPDRLADFMLGTLGVFHLLAAFCVYAGLSFNSLLLMLPIAMGSGGLAVWWLDEAPAAANDGASPLPPTWTVAIAAAACVAWALGAPLIVGVIGVLCVIVPAAWKSDPMAVGAAPEVNTRDLVAIALAGTIGAGLAISMNRWDVDDGYYLNAVVQHLEHPTLAVLSFDGLHGDLTAPIQQVMHRPQSYELLVAAVAKFAPVHPHGVYWIFVPAFFAALASVAHWRLARVLAPNVAWLATLLTPVILFMWGDAYETYGGFAYVRMFQGKAVFATVFVPFLVHAALSFSRKPSPQTWTRVALAMMACSMCTSTALLVAPIACGLALLAAVRPDRLKDAAIGLLATVPVLIILVLAQQELAARGGVNFSGEALGLDHVFGRYRQQLTLVALGLLACLTRSGWLQRYLLVTVALLFNGVTTSILGNFAKLLYWRTYWAVPVAPLLGIGLALALSRLVQNDGWPTRRRIAVLLCGVMIAFGPIGRWTNRAGNHPVQWTPFLYKVHTGARAGAEHVVRITEPNDVVLTPGGLASHIAGMPNKPKQVAIWYRYLGNMKHHWGPGETNRRRALFNYVNGGSSGKLNPLLPKDAFDKHECISVVVLQSKRREKTADDLRSLRYRRETVGDYDIWSKDCAKKRNRKHKKGAAR
jgi:hypothetical protein